MESSHAIAFLAYSVLAASGLVAQGVIASPAGSLNQEGEGAAHIFGRYADGRFQFAEGDLKGTARNFTGLAYRLDYRDHSASTAMGRKWSNVTVRVGVQRANSGRGR